MMNLNFSPFPTLRTERLVLRQLENNDADALFFLRSDERVLKFLDRPGVTSIKEIYDYINNIHSLAYKSEAILWAITLKGNNDLIGNICFWRIEKENYRAEAGYVLHPDFQGKGLMNEAMAAVLAYGFNSMNLHSVVANVNPENTASIQLLERCGFVREAYFRENFYFNGRFMDTIIYTHLKRDHYI